MNLNGIFWYWPLWIWENHSITTEAPVLLSPGNHGFYKGIIPKSMAEVFRLNRYCTLPRPLDLCCFLTKSQGDIHIVKLRIWRTIKRKSVEWVWNPQERFEVYGLITASVSTIRLHCIPCLSIQTYIQYIRTYVYVYMHTCWVIGQSSTCEKHVDLNINISYISV